MTQSSTVIGVFENSQMAEQAINELQHGGFNKDQIGYVFRHHNSATTEGETVTPEPQLEAEEPAGGVTSGIVGGVLGAADIAIAPIVSPGTAESMLETALPVAEQAIDRVKAIGKKKTPEQENDEAISDEQKMRVEEGVGVASGGIVGGVLGAAAALLIPGIGPALAGGILIAALGGAAIGAVSGGFLSTFVGMGVPAHKAHYYQREFEAGRIIVTVKTDNRQQDAMDILRRNGAHDVEVHTI